MCIGEQPVPAVQLRHELPDGSWHIDLMIAVDPEGTQPLITFRLPLAIGDLSPGRPTPITALGDHRPTYLRYEGPVSGGRGTVKRVWYGRARWIRRDPDSFLLSLSPTPRGETTIRLTRQVDDRWILDFAGDASQSPAE